MKKLLLSILLALFIALPANATIPYHGFFGLPWGTSREKILETTQGSLNTDGQVMVGGKSPRGVVIAVYYGFDENKSLNNVLVFTKPEPGTDLIQFCAEKTSIYDSKFGRFDKLEISITGGPLLVWENNDTQVQMMCDTENGVFVVLHLKKGIGPGLISTEKKIKTINL